MKKIVFCVSLLLLAGAASADDLAEANAMFKNKAFPQALQMYTKLANAGNAEAQLHLGEMYWYGEAGAVDEGKADAWFRKSAGKGNKGAAAALEIMKQRTARRADIDYWISKYDGADLKSGPYRCPAPRLPAVSKTQEEIDSVAGRIAAWQLCYNGFVRNMNAAAPLAKLIPADVEKLMNQQEMDKARAYLDGVYVTIAEDAKINAKLVLADVGAWRSATDAYVTERNLIMKSLPSAERQQDIDARKRNYAPGK